jgi:hypothetical protein
MRRIITWLSATAVAVALLIGHQLVFASSGEEGKGGQPCPTVTAAASQDPDATLCEPAGGSPSASADRPGGCVTTCTAWRCCWPGSP